MNDEQLDLARRLAAHPRFQWRRGAQPVYEPAPFVWGRLDRVEEDGWNPQHCDDIALPDGWPDAKREAYPDLTDAATGGVLLDVLGPGWTVITRIGKVDAHPTGCAGPPGVSGATVAEACARALLAEWEATPATPETTAS